jgi:hypothetical protein
MRLFKNRERLKTEKVSDLSQAYKVLKQITWSHQKGVDDGGKKRTFLTLSLDEIQNEIIMEIQNEIIMSALDKAKELLETGSTARALEHIAFDWFQVFADESELIPLDDAKRLFENTYDVQVIIHHNEIGA